MRTSRLALLIGLPVVVSVAIFAACSSDDPARPEPAGGPDAFVGKDTSTASDVSVLPDTSTGPQPTCTPVDIAPGTGKKYCELPGSDTPDLQVPTDFCVREFTTTPVTEARVLSFAPNGDLFVAAPSMLTPGGAADGAGSIMVLPDDDGDGRADSVVTYAGPSPRGGQACGTLEADPNNLACVHGLVFTGGYLYFTRSDEVRRVPYTAGDRAIAGASELVAKLGGATISDVRWTHTLEKTKTGSLYVSRGRFDSSACSTEEMTRGAVFELHVETGAAMPLTPEVVANGFRNPMYLRCSTASCGECFASELSGDNWDGVGGREKLALLEKNKPSWGYPCCVGPTQPAPGVNASDCINVGRELTSIALHDTPFGLDFDRGGFPAPYTHGLFVALHGVVSSFGGSGVVWVKTDPKSLRPTSSSTLFVKGFGKPLGRATDVAFSPDGRMFIADDTSGKIYWVAPKSLAAPK